MSTKTKKATKKVTISIKVTPARRRRKKETDRLPDEIAKECRDAFRMFDENGDGSITFEELAKVMHVLGNNPTDTEMADMMKGLDKDNSGTVDIDEFLNIVAKHWKDPIDEEKELREAFEIFDRDKDGFVKADEIKYVMKTLGQNLTDSEVENILKKADTNKDGKLDYQEFVKYMQQAGK